MHPFGFNVIGFASGNLGLGVIARNVIRLVQARGFSLAVVDLDPGGGRAGIEAIGNDVRIVEGPELPYAINMFIVPPLNLSWLRERLATSVTDESRLNSILSFWELPLLNAGDVRALNDVDVVIGCSVTMRATYESALSGPQVIGAMLPVHL